MVFLERRRKAFPTEAISEAEVWSVKCVWETAHSEVPWSGLNMEWEGGWCLRCSCRGRRGQITKDWIYKAKDFRLFCRQWGAMEGSKAGRRMMRLTFWRDEWKLRE